MAVETFKRCGGCRETKPLSDFYRSARSRDGHQHRCKICQSGTAEQRARMRRCRASHPDRRGERLARYGLTVADFDHLLIAQAGRCGGCGDLLLAPCVDHDHASGEVRGLLCDPCNRALGHARDNADRLCGLAAYLG